MPYYKVGPFVRFDPADIDEWLVRQRGRTVGGVMIDQTVQVFSIVTPRKGTAKEKRRFRVKWRIDGHDFSKQFKTKAEAERLRSRLLVAVSDGLVFNPATGRPREWERSTETWWTWSTTWLGLMWPQWSGNSRRSGVESLVAVTPHLAKPRAPEPPKGLRAWLLDVGYRPNLDEPEPGLELDWLKRWSIPLDLVEAPLLETAVARATTRQDGKPMSPNVVRRRRNTIKAVFSAAVRRQVLSSNPFDRAELKRPQRRQEVDVATVPSVADLNELVARVWALKTNGARYAAFFATIGLAGLRPSEVSNLLVRDLDLPDHGWGLARLRGATTSPGQRYTARRRNEGGEGPQTPSTRCDPRGPDPAPAGRNHGPPPRPLRADRRPSLQQRREPTRYSSQLRQGLETGAGQALAGHTSMLNCDHLRPAPHRRHGHASSRRQPGRSRPPPRTLR